MRPDAWQPAARSDPAETRAPLTAGTWDIDPAHTFVEFTVRHMTIAPVTGRFGEVSGEVQVPADDPRAAAVSVTIDATTVSSGHPRRDELIGSAEFLDTGNYPVIIFRSQRATGRSDSHWDLPGTLTIKGISRAVILDTVFGGVVVHRGAPRAGFTATAQVSRKDFGLSWNGLLEGGGAIVSDAVAITIAVEIVLAADEADVPE